MEWEIWEWLKKEYDLKEYLNFYFHYTWKKSIRERYVVLIFCFLIYS